MNTTTQPGPLEVRLSDQLGLEPERDAVLAQLDNTTNQTWAGKRRRWAALVRAQDAEIQRLRAALRGLLALDEANSQRGGDDEDICAEVRAAYEALGPNVAIEPRR